MWDPDQYLRFADERARPFFDLLARVRHPDARAIADLGCGPGNLTRILAERWPGARVIGVDSSPAMLAQAQPVAIPGRLDFIEAGISTWRPAAPLDLIFTSAALQWVGDHDVLLPRLVSMLAPAGVLALQMPYHFASAAHEAIEEAKADPRWRAELTGVGLHRQSVQPLAWYVELLHDLAVAVDAWQTTYMHVLQGEQPVLEWFKGTALRPLIERLAEPLRSAFLADVARRFAAAYPPRHGITLLPFTRLFVVATRHG